MRVPRTNRAKKRRRVVSCTRGIRRRIAHRMGAWIRDRKVAVETGILRGRQCSRSHRIFSKGLVCDGGGGFFMWKTGTLSSLSSSSSSSSSPTDLYNCHLDIAFRSCYSCSAYSTLRPLRRQFTRQLYEWPVLPSFKSRTKLVGGN
ncbi:uncharacterized protein LOC107268987 [Cephus cinctus]|uniref:Uncharacterized protein LOC107268987 n=1 Tax=Cephus cinctus TaxID=211228 RepID=A0AAJ7BYW7_CEPCN|nr:uncharacterized protein LOC107268987 [Cephus cinctus]